MNRLFSLLVLGLALSVSACMSSGSMSGDASMGDGDMSAGVMVGGAMMTPDRSIPENAMNANNLTTLVAAVQAAELVETLSGPGPFTVFAPVNSAFEALPAGTVETLLMPENQGQLQAVLTYHVVPGRLMAADLRDGQMLTTVNGAQLTVRKSGMNVMIEDANGNMATVTTANVVSTNGISHVIDAVLLPGM